MLQVHFTLYFYNWIKNGLIFLEMYTTIMITIEKCSKNICIQSKKKSELSGAQSGQIHDEKLFIA